MNDAFTIIAKFQDKNQPPVSESAANISLAQGAAVRLRRQFAALQLVSIKNNRTGEMDVYYPVPERENEAKVADGFQFYGLRLAFIVPPMPSRGSAPPAKKL
jgi:hypothetical protein